MYEPTFNPDKFRGLILYAAHRARQYEDPFFGAVKLNKTLFFSDFFGFRQLGRSITGATYQKLSEGPAPRQLVDERQKMVIDELITIEPVPIFGYVQHRIVPADDMIDPTDYFNLEEQGVIDSTISAIRGMTGAQVSDVSHLMLGWRLANKGETIPYETVWLGSVPVSAEVEWALGEDGG
ncbi:MAG: SocA family protein [Chloroflexi bacterium]|nr:SocA family protein [Chloroflexota bacterium]